MVLKLRNRKSLASVSRNPSRREIARQTSALASFARLRGGEDIDTIDDVEADDDFERYKFRDETLSNQHMRLVYNYEPETFLDKSFDLYTLFERVGINSELNEEGINLDSYRGSPVEDEVFRKWNVMVNLTKFIEKDMNLGFTAARELAITLLRFIETRPIQGMDMDFQQMLAERGTGRDVYQGIRYTDILEQEQPKWKDFYDKRRRAKRWEKGKPPHENPSSDFETTTTITTDSAAQDVYRGGTDDDSIWNVWKKPEGWNSINFTDFGLPNPWDREQKRARKKKLKAFYEKASIQDPNSPDKIRERKLLAEFRKKMKVKLFHELDENEKMIWLSEQFQAEMDVKKRLIRCIDLGALRDHGARIFKELQTLDEEAQVLATTRNYTRAKLVIDFVQGGSRMYPGARAMVEDQYNFPLGKYSWDAEDGAEQELTQPCGFIDCECGMGPADVDVNDYMEDMFVQADPFFRGHNQTIDWTKENVTIKNTGHGRFTGYEDFLEEINKPLIDGKPIEEAIFVTTEDEDEPSGAPRSSLGQDLASDGSDISSSATSEAMYLNEEVGDIGVLARQFIDTRGDKTDRMIQHSDEAFEASSGEKSAEEEDEVDQRKLDAAAEDEDAYQGGGFGAGARADGGDYKDEAELDALLERQEFGA